jgi:hypothetical protein
LDSSWRPPQPRRPLRRVTTRNASLISATPSCSWAMTWAARCGTPKTRPTRSWLDSSLASAGGRDETSVGWTRSIHPTHSRPRTRTSAQLSRQYDATFSALRAPRRTTTQTQRERGRSGWSIIRHGFATLDRCWSVARKPVCATVDATKRKERRRAQGNDTSRRLDRSPSWRRRSLRRPGLGHCWCCSASCLRK